MKVKELIAALIALEKPDAEIMILDGFNGGGYPRDINYGIGTEVISEDHADKCGDCEGRVNEFVYVMGYGCY